MKVKKLGFGLSTLATLSVIPISVVTMPLVLNQPVYAQAIYGAIFDKWVSMGGYSSPVGSPITNDLKITDQSIGIRTLVLMLCMAIFG